MAKLISKLNIQVNIETTDYEIREEKVRDGTYWVVPVVMMVEGVHHGSRGPLLYTQEELAATVNAWDGMPVTIGHPQDDKGRYISANSPNVLKGIVGRIYNAKMKGKKLTAEVWIDMAALVQVSTDAVEYIKEKKALDVSVGVFSQEEGDPGDFNGESFLATATNIVPDHLALLPGEDGACNWNDGCGIRNNSKHNMDKKDKSKALVVDKKACLQTFLETNQGIDLIDNKASFNQIVSSVYDQLNSMDTERQAFYLEDVFDNYVVYSVVNRETREKTMYKRDYKLADNGKIEFQGEPVEVRKKVTFVNMSLKRTNFNSKSKMKVNKKCTCTVDGLIQNEATQFTEADRKWLATFSQEQLEKLSPKDEEEEEEEVEEGKKPVVSKKATEPAIVKEKDTDGGPLVSKDKDGNIVINGKSIGEHFKEELGKEGDAVKFIDNFMPDGLKNQMKAGLKMYQGHRESQIKEIVANSKFKAEQLKGWSDEDLTALHGTVVPEEEAAGNYSPFGGAGSREGGEVEENVGEITAMLGFEQKPEVAKEVAK